MCLEGATLGAAHPGLGPVLSVLPPTIANRSGRGNRNNHGSQRARRHNSIAIASTAHAQDSIAGPKARNVQANRSDRATHPQVTRGESLA
eukprot:4047017-Alexandrium_andersonii.AAC.1